MHRQIVDLVCNYRNSLFENFTGDKNEMICDAGGVTGFDCDDDDECKE